MRKNLYQGNDVSSQRGIVSDGPVRGFWVGGSDAVSAGGGGESPFFRNADLLFNGNLTINGRGRPFFLVGIVGWVGGVNDKHSSWAGDSVLWHVKVTRQGVRTRILSEIIHTFRGF